MKATVKKDRRSTIRKRENAASTVEPVIKLYELIQGERGIVKIYSEFLECEIYLINPGVTNLPPLPDDCPIYTTEELAFLVNLSEDDLRRYHYLKTRLIG